MMEHKHIQKQQADINADLHIHSKISDGSETIDEIIKIAKQKGLTHIAITDHDTLDGTFYAVSQGKKEGLMVIPGVEISAIDLNTGKKVHILGYGIKHRDPITALCEPLLKRRHLNCLKQIGILNQNGYCVPENILKKNVHQYIYKQHIMDYLVSTGQVEEMFGDFYQKIFKNRGICDFDISYINACDAVKAVKKAGGFAVLAHPGQQQNFDSIHGLVSAGLDGLELNHLSNSEKDRNHIREMACQYELFLTGGSDYHGRFEKQTVEIGCFTAEKEAVEIICTA
ncbi:MAG: PHP domain-containing protein [Eubacteriales bacterium]